MFSLTDTRLCKAYLELRTGGVKLLVLLLNVASQTAGRGRHLDYSHAHTHTPPGPKCNPLAAEKVEASAAGLESFY